MKIGASLRRPAAAVSRVQSDACNRPVRTDCESTFASAQSMRCTSCWADISRLRISTRLRRMIPTNCAMLSTKAVFPVDGRPAMMMKSEG